MYRTLLGKGRRVRVVLLLDSANGAINTELCQVISEKFATTLESTVKVVYFVINLLQSVFIRVPPWFFGAAGSWLHHSLRLLKDARREKNQEQMQTELLYTPLLVQMKRWLKISESRYIN